MSEASDKTVAVLDEMADHWWTTLSPEYMVSCRNLADMVGEPFRERYMELLERIAKGAYREGLWKGFCDGKGWRE